MVGYTYDGRNRTTRRRFDHRNNLARLRKSLSWIYREETFDAALAVTGDPILANSLAIAVALVDAPTQGTSWEMTRFRSMAGRKNGQKQTCQQPYRSTSDFVAQAAAAHSFAGDSDAIHAIQDSYASGHQYQFWPGGGPSGSHLWGDAQYLPDAESATENYLRTNGSLRPGNYLFPSPCPCH